MVSNGGTRFEWPMPVSINKIRLNPNYFDSTDLAGCLSSPLILIMSLRQPTEHNEQNESEEKKNYRVISVCGSLLQCAESIFSVISRYFEVILSFLFFLFRCVGIRFEHTKEFDWWRRWTYFALFGYSIRYGIVTMIFTVTVSEAERISKTNKSNSNESSSHVNCIWFRFLNKIITLFRTCHDYIWNDCSATSA